jgi:hypothetical protein
LDAVKSEVERAQSALAVAIAKAGLAADPLGHALQALSLSIGAQLSLHEAATGRFTEMSGRLDQAVAEAVERGESALNERRQAIVASLVPELAEAVRRSVRSWNRVVTIRVALAAIGLAATCTIAAGAIAFAAGWRAGEATGLNDKATLAGAIAQAGPDTVATLGQIVRDNDLPGIVADCRKNSYMRDERRACVIPVWLDPAKAPAKPGA